MNASSWYRQTPIQVQTEARPKEDVRFCQTSLLELKTGDF